MQLLPLLTLATTLLLFAIAGGLGRIVVRWWGGPWTAALASPGFASLRSPRLLLWLLVTGWFGAILQTATAQASLWTSVVTGAVSTGEVFGEDASAWLAAIPLGVLGIVLVLAGYALALAVFRRADRVCVRAALGRVVPRREATVAFVLAGMFVAHTCNVARDVLVELTALIRPIAPTLSIGLTVLGLCVGYGYGVFVARRLVAAARASGALACLAPGRTTGVGAVALVAGVVAPGVSVLLGSLGHAIESAGLLAAALAGDFDPGAFGTPTPVVATTVIYHLCPLLVYPAAARVVRRANWRALRDRTGWEPPRVARWALVLAVGAWLLWPVDIAVTLEGVFSGAGAFVAPVAAWALYVAALYRWTAAKTASAARPAGG